MDSRATQLKFVPSGSIPCKKNIGCTHTKADLRLCCHVPSEVILHSGRSNLFDSLELKESFIQSKGDYYSSLFK